LCDRQLKHIKSFERLQLAALILSGLTSLDKNIIDDSDIWIEENQLEIAAFSM